MDNSVLSSHRNEGGATILDETNNGINENLSTTLQITASLEQLNPPCDTHSIRALVDPSNGNDRRRFSGITRSHWFTVITLCFVNLINYMDRFTTAGVLNSIQVDFKIGDDDGGLLQTSFVLSYMMCAPVFGYLGDRYSRRWIMAVGVLLWSTTTLLGSFMTNFGWFLTFRALVGIGEASYSTTAPTIISDLFINDVRSKMLALFYFAIPVGSGFGYIVGSETARIAENWRWALRVTPVLGVIAVILILLIKDPEHGESEGTHHQLEPTNYTQDLRDLMKNSSFMLSTAGLTCLAFVAGALSWWGPKCIFLGLRMQPNNETTQNDISYKFGIITMFAGLIGVPLGSILAQRLRSRHEQCDPFICALGLFISAPMVYFALILPQKSAALCLFFVFVAQLSLNLCWSIIADILLYVVIPTRRSTAEAFQILISHALGDAGSPYLVGVLSEAIQKHFRRIAHFADDNIQITTIINTTLATVQQSTNQTLLELGHDVLSGGTDADLVKFVALQYALFSTCFVEVLGGIFFLITAAFILKDKRQASSITTRLDELQQSVTNHPPVDIHQISPQIH